MSTRLAIDVTLLAEDTSSGSCGCDAENALRRRVALAIGIDGDPQSGHVDLTTDSPESVAFGDVAEANVVLLQVTTRGKVRARITSADGSAQSVPVDGIFLLVTQSVPITAIDLTRVSGSGDSPRVFFALADKL